MPPDNGGYMVAAYILTALILVGYALGLVRRAATRGGTKTVILSEAKEPERRCRPLRCAQGDMLITLPLKLRPSPV